MMDNQVAYTTRALQMNELTEEEIKTQGLFWTSDIMSLS